MARRRVEAPPPPLPTRRRMMPELPPSGSILVGTIHSYDPTKGYGFIKCGEVSCGDVYFQRNLLPPEAQTCHRSALAGKEVEFELLLTPDGKPRAERVFLLSALDHRNGDRLPTKDPTPPLDEHQIKEMTRLLEEKGGAMDYGRFANAFPGIKKSQVAEHFSLVPESQDTGGRWQITLPGYRPFLSDDQEAIGWAEGRWSPNREGEPERVEEANEEHGNELLNLEPSPTLRLIGCVKQWDSERGYGLVDADGATDVAIEKADLPPEVQTWKGNLEGAELTFELEVSDDGRLTAKFVHFLLAPNDSGWQLRFVN